MNKIMLHMVSWDGKMTPKCHWNPYMWRCIRAVVKFLNCAVYFPDDNSEKYPGILYPGDMTEYRGLIMLWSTYTQKFYMCLHHFNCYFSFSVLRIVIGTKTDLPSKVSEVEVKNFCSKVRCPFENALLMSSKTSKFCGKH